MTVYVVTTSNWNSPAFWSGISETVAGHTFDFTALGPSYSVNYQSSLGFFEISDGTTTFRVGEAGYAGGSDANLGGTTDLDFFNVLSLTQGADNAFGTGSADTIQGFGGDDTLMGGAGNDSILGGDDNDSIMAESGNDTVRGGDGDDYIAHSTGSDELYGDAGNDTIFGGGTSASGHDTMYGGTGNDYISGVLGNDQAFGNEGDDTLLADQNDDTLDGGADADTFLVQDNFGYDTITGGETVTTSTDNDTLDLSTLSNGVTLDFNGDERGHLTDGTNSLDFAEIENVTLTGQADTVDATNDSTGLVIDGAAGNDTISGGSGDDSILGGTGNDVIVGDPATATHRGPELLSNGSFEHGTHAANSVSGLDNWVTYSGSPDSADDGTSAESWNPALDASDGTGYVTMWSNPSAPSEGIKQDLSTALDAGKSYTLTVQGQTGDYISSTYFTPSNIPVTFEIFDANTGAVLGSTTMQGTSYTEYSITFTPATAVTSIGFRPVGTGVGTYPSVTIDEISLAETSVTAGSGNDTLVGGDGDDTITGGDGDDVYVLSDGSGNDVITDFDIGDDNGDGVYNDQFDVSTLTDSGGNPVNAWDVVVSDDGFGNARLAFPNGETVILEGIAPSQIDGAQELFAAGIACFAEGTMIATANGEVAVENLTTKDRLVTLDHGIQPVRWIGKRTYSADELRANPDLAPVYVEAGLLNNQRPLVVSPCHGMLLSRKHGLDGEKLVRAKHLTEVRGGARRAMGKRGVTYYHILLPQHGIIFADGCPSESFYPGFEGMCMFGAAQLAALSQLIPGLTTLPPHQAYGHRAREFAPRNEVVAKVDLRPFRKEHTASFENSGCL